MSSSKHLSFAILVALVVIGLGGVLLAWPGYREAAVVNEKADLLRMKGENYEAQAKIIDKLTAELEDATERVDSVLKEVPESPDIAGLMRVLSLPVDAVNVRDQTFTAGEPREAAQGADLATRITPLTVDMEARFDAVFALLRSAETMDRLLRVASVNVTCNRGDDVDQPFAKATIVLEVVYEPPEEEVR